MKNTIKRLPGDDFGVLTDAERKQLEKEIAAADAETARLLRSDPKYLRGVRPGRPDDHE
jgi:hypothetical protein